MNSREREEEDSVTPGITGHGLGKNESLMNARLASLLQLSFSGYLTCSGTYYFA